MEELKRAPGGQPGNQNARRHGFYSDLLDEIQRADFEQALLIDGLDVEIALMRVKIRAVIRDDPDNLKLIIHAAESLARLVKVKYGANKNDPRELQENLGNVFGEIALHIGTDIAKAIFGI